MHQFSIITPTYNRQQYLPRIYDCLTKQGDIDLEWVIVDDGSTDNTKEIVSRFGKDFEVKYVYQENAGKPTAMNYGLKLADSYVSVSLDSDDILCPHILREVWDYFNTETYRFENNCVCLAGLCQYENGDTIGKSFPKDYMVSDYINLIKNENIIGDKCLFYSTDIFKENCYPTFKNEKNIAPGIVHNSVAFNHKTLYVNKIFAEKQFLADGLSNKNYWLMYPLGSELYYNETSISPYKLKLQIEHTGKYIFFARLNKKKDIYNNAKNKQLFVLGILYYFFYSFKLILKKFKILQDINNKIKRTLKYNKANRHKVIKNV